MLEEKLQMCVISTISERYIVNLGSVEIEGSSMVNGGKMGGTHYSAFSGNENINRSYNKTGIKSSAHKSLTASVSSGFDEKSASAMALEYFAMDSQWAYQGFRYVSKRSRRK